METLTKSQKILKKLPKLLNKKARIDEFKKKHAAHVEDRIQQNVRIQTAMAHKIIMTRERHLMSTPMKDLPEVVDKLARARQMRKRKEKTAKKSS